MAPKRWSPLKLLEGADRWRYTTDYEESQTLTGSTTKGDSYTRGIFGDLNWEARKLLREHDRIVCSGYGWRDEAFNAMLKDWSDEHENRRMLLLHGLRAARSPGLGRMTGKRTEDRAGCAGSRLGFLKPGSRQLMRSCLAASEPPPLRKRLHWTYALWFLSPLFQVELKP
jgi:hypothetical protein